MKNGEVWCVYIRPQEAKDMEFDEQHQAQIWKRLAALIKLRDIGSFKSVCERVNEGFKMLVEESLRCYIFKKKNLIFRTAVWLFQLPYHFDRTGVRVMAICPGVTDTALISEAPRRLLREEWAEYFKRDVDTLPNQKWVLVIKEWPILHCSYASVFTWYYGCKLLYFC
jgi:hypothetical protein